jgi:ABC-type lipoprotein export system ATPase subunit
MQDFQNYIELHNISKTYGKDIALNVDYYKIPLDGIVTIVGFSGNGKTTLLNIIGLLDIPDIRTDARLVYKINDEMYEITYTNHKINIINKGTKVDTNDFRREFLSFVFQENMLHPSLSTVNNILMPLRAANQDYDSEMAQLFDNIGLNHTHNKSGGQKQRTAILRALIKKSKIVFADEPTSSLDKPRSIQTLKTLQNVNTIWVTHDMLLAKDFSKYIIVVDKGKLCTLTKNNNAIDMLSMLGNGCGCQKTEELPVVDIGEKKSLSVFQKLSFISEYAFNDLIKPFKDFAVLSAIIIFSFLSILLINKISYSLDTIVKTKLNDPRVSYIQIIQDSAVGSFDNDDFIKLKKSIQENDKFTGKCEVSKLKGYPSVRFKKGNGKFCNLTLGTFQKDSKLFTKMLDEGEFNNTNNININKKVDSDDPLSVEDNLNFVIIGKEARSQHGIADQEVTTLGDTDIEVRLIEAKDKLPLDQELFVRDEFFATVFNNREPKGFSIMLYPKDIQTSLALLEWLKYEKDKFNIIEKKFYISDENDKYNSLKLITTIEKIISVMMNVVLVILVFLLGLVAFVNIYSNTKNKYKELGIMLSFGMSKKYFFSFYILKAVLLSLVAILVTFFLFHFIEILWLDPYLKEELFKNILAIAKTGSDDIISLTFPIKKQVEIFVIGSIVILFIFLFTISLAIFKVPSKLIKE